MSGELCGSSCGWCGRCGYDEDDRIDFHEEPCDCGHSEPGWCDHFTVEPDVRVPTDEVWLVQNGKVACRIINIKEEK